MASVPNRPIDRLRQKFGATLALSDEREKEQATLRASHGGADPGLLAGALGFEAAEVFGNRGTRRRLPPAARGGRKFVAPRTPLEETLAAVWSEVLRIDDLSVHDNFFELGGHSLFAISVIDKMRQIGLKVGVRSLFEAPTIAELSASVGAETSFVAVPPNLIPEACSRITPDMLTLIDLDQSQIDAIVTKVPDGASNVQDIYPLAPLQDGFLFHHRQTSEGDLYTMLTQFGFDSRERLDAYVKALQVVVNRHDTMRSMFLWEGLEEPVQVVCRSASIGIEEVRFDPAHGDIAAQLREKFNASNFRFDLAVPPLIRIYIAQDTEKGRWVLHQLTHHFMGDRVSIGIQEAEVKAILQDQGETLPRAAQFRNYVAQARLGMPQAEHSAYFGDMLADVDEPTVPFGIVDVLGAGARVDEVNRLLDADLSRRVVEVARRIGVSTAALFHEAFAQLLARISNRDDVVFGTVLLGRMIGGDGAERIIGPCINTVPIRIHTGGRSLRDGVRRTQSLLAKSLRHEHAPLSLSQRCSGVRSDLPVFNSILNYRRAAPETNGPGQKADAGVAGTGDEVKITDRFLEDIQGRSFISFEERTNFPITLSIDDLGDGFRLVAQVREPIDPNRFCSYMETFLRQLIEGLETDPDRRLDELTILPNEERRLLLQDWQGAVVNYPDDRTLAQVFTARVTASPSATAVIDGGVAFTFEAIDRKADAIAARLVAAGVRAPDRVGLHLDRSADLVAAIIACLKLGASFVPIATTLPGGRIAYLVEDSGARAVVTSSGHAADFVNPVRIDTLTDDEIEDAPALDPVSVDPGSAAYVMYTSGSTGQPKGVVGTHRATLNRFAWMWRAYPFEADEVMCQKTAISFGDSIWEVLGPLLAGVPQVVVPQDTVEEPRAFLTMLGRHGVTRLLIVPSLLRAILDSGLRLCEAAPSLRLLFTSGERLPADLARQFLDTAPDIRLINLYGASEVAADVTVHEVGPLDIDGGEVPIGKPIDNCRVYVLDHLRQLVPVGVSGELYVGGAALAAGYLGRDDLTRARFLPDPFADQPDALMFATGDIVHHCDDGALIYEGRRDLQIKIRGMRVNLGEIETVLASQPGIAEAAVVVKGEGAAAWLLACVTPDGTAAAAPDAAALRRALTNTLPHYMVPARIAVIDAMPLNPSGKLDRATLSNLADAAVETPGDAVPEGRTETERALLDRLQSLLHVDNLSVEDNFFEIGGNSLLALLLFDWIRSELGQDLPISTLFRHQTVRAIALYLDDLSATLPTCGDRDPRDDDWDTTTVIHPGPDGTDAPPLFIVGGIGGNVNNLFELGRLLGRHRPVVGFQTRGVLGHRPHETIEDIAADDIHHMRQHQPKGPYSIGSYSGGAYTALEIARQLEAAGETVDHLLVIDSFTPQFAKRHMAAKRPRLSERLSLEFVLFQRNGLSSFVQRLRHQLSAQLVRGPLRPLVKQYGPDQYRYTTMLEAWRIAARGYCGGAVNACVTLFASDPTTSTVLSATRLDPTFGWSDLAAPDRFTRVEVGGSHLDMVKGPSAVLLAEEIEKALKRKPTGADLDYRTDEGKSRLAQ